MYQAIPGSFCAIKLLHQRDRQKLTLSFVIIQIRTMGRGLQKNGQHAFAWVFGSLWWLDQEREQHGEPCVCMINFGQIFNILLTSVAGELK